MSSPDPLTDSTMADLASHPSSATRRITRSQQAQRFLSLNDSPRKQMFELQVGDRVSPQRLLVTVETEGQNNFDSSARRKLFQSPVSASSMPARQRRGRTTTTTVPLRESIEEDRDDATTPKSRGRQRKSNGTPMPGAGTKRRAGTPVKRTPRRPRTMASEEVEEPRPEPNVRATPTTSMNLRPRKTPSTATSSRVGIDHTPRASTARRGRRRRQALAPDELLELADEVGDINLDTTQLPPVTSDDEVDLVRAPSESTDDEAVNAPRPTASAVPSSPSPATGALAEPDSDIWIASLSNEATPKPPARTRDVIPESSPHFATLSQAKQPEYHDIETSQTGDYDDYDYGNLDPAASDGSSINEPLGGEHPPATSAPSGYDTIAQGEDFSMIFMESIQSLHPNFNSSVHPIVHEELGDDTNLIINNTLESLRQGVDRDDSGEDSDTMDSPEAAGPTEPELAEEEPSQEAPAEEMPSERETATVLQLSSPSQRLNHRWSRSPLKAGNSSPLRHRVLKYSAMQAEESATAQATQNNESPSSPQPDRNPQNAYPLGEEEQSNPYEDSFSEIPEEVLTAATPRRPQVSTTFDELEDEVDEVRFEESQDEEMPDDDEHQDVESTKELQQEMAQVHEESDVHYPELSHNMMQVQQAEEQVLDDMQDERHFEGNDDEGEEMAGEMFQHGRPTQNLAELQDLGPEDFVEDEEQNDEGISEEYQDAELESEPELTPELEPDQTKTTSPVADGEEEHYPEEFQTEEDDVDDAPDVRNEEESEQEAEEQLAQEEENTEDEGVEEVVTQRVEALENEDDIEEAMEQAAASQRNREEESEEDEVEEGLTRRVEALEDEDDIEEATEQTAALRRNQEEKEDMNDDMGNEEASEQTVESQRNHTEEEDVDNMGNDVDEDVNEDGEFQDEPVVMASVMSTTGQSDGTRLPTPDDTPPQIETQAVGDSGDKSNRGSRPSSRLRSSPTSPGHFRSSPRHAVEQLASLSRSSPGLRSSPRYPSLAHLAIEAPKQVGEPEEEDEEMEDEEMEDTPTADEEEALQDPTELESQRQTALAEATRRSFEATPLHQISSPLQEPQSLQQESLLHKTIRPHLSAIVRAGQVLQSITSDPPSPEGRDKQLGSPFRRSGSKDSWSGSRDSQTSRRMSRSPMQSRNSATAVAKSDSSAQPETSNAVPEYATRSNFSRTSRRSKEPSIERDRSPFRQSPASSMHITPPSDGDMSWVAREGPISPNLRGDNSLREAAGLPEPNAARATFIEDISQPLQVPGYQPPHESTPEAEMPEAEQEIRDDETDIWELEAERETPRPTRQRSFGKRVPTSNHRRGAIPSPWTKKSIHRPPVSRMISQTVPDLSHLTEEPSAVQDQPSQSSEPDEYSLLAQRQQEEEAAKKAATTAESAAKDKRFDLSSFFSSPAAIPGMLAQKFLPNKTQPVTQPAPPMSVTERAPSVVPTSSMFPQIPQKEFRPDSSVKSTLFSPVRRRQPVAAGVEEQPQGHTRQSQPSQPSQQQPETASERSSSPATPEQLPMPTVAQKQNFTPRPRQPSHSFFQPSSNRSTAVTPPRMQLTHADIHRWTQQTSNASEASSDFQRPLLRPLPPKNASPTKSALRSPLKPHTPGRVVEFTSSVLSPAEQAKARHLSNSILSQPDPFAPQTNSSVVFETDDKENSDIIDISMEDAPPLVKQSVPEPLSQTTWTRQHWLFLDQLLQLRRRQPFPINYARRADKYLGKTVKSHGESMTLQRWHLDCVDAFKAEVGLWDEGVLAKRLFALILGEQRRRGGMFH
ncbi:hypothetical protein QQS21_005187 [Conoideocrella luteorostrata]|uniref:Uncharacterized protein n=1 Tax=Conoideocrella luteorostrata TaxID=1105319 RepID=A0AAJ0CQ58_9HYPO|nr:hypothetical protein QQS21_005187 [Conoideocrella luteorostrata]